MDRSVYCQSPFLDKYFSNSHCNIIQQVFEAISGSCVASAYSKPRNGLIMLKPVTVSTEQNKLRNQYLLPKGVTFTAM